MPYVQNNNVNVRYEAIGDLAAPPLVLIFGFSMCCEDWFELGYVEKLSRDFRVVCVDPRGHGGSSHPDDPTSYSLSALASDVEAVIAVLHLEQPLIWGYSLGAKIALAMAGRRPAAYKGLILGGLELHGQVDLHDDLVATTLLQGPQAWRALWAQMFDVPAGLSKRLAEVDTRALHSLRVAEAQWPTLQGDTEAFDAPALLYAGAQCFFRDSTAAATGHFRSARFLERPGRNHFALMLDATWIVEEVVRHFGPLTGRSAGRGPASNGD